MITKEMIEAATEAIDEAMGPVVGNPEYLAKHSDRLIARKREAARKYAEAALTAALSSQWRGMESAPKDGTRILIWVNPEGAYAVYYDSADAEFPWRTHPDSDALRHDIPTCWHPIVPPATQEGEITAASKAKP